MKRLSFEYISKEAKNTEGMNNKQTIQFHYFNPNGLVEQWRKNCDRITKAVNDGVVKSGWHIAYGSFDDFYMEEVLKLARKERVNRISMQVAINMLQERIELVNNKLEEIGY